MRIAWLCVFVLVGSALAQAPSTRTFVSNGEARDVREMGGAWETGDRVLSQEGVGKLLVAGRAVGAGDFRIAARIALDAIDGTAASLQLGSGSHFGFDGRGRTLFVEGPLFARFRNLGPNAGRIVGGEPFDVVAERRDGRLRLSIDGELVHVEDVGDETIGRIALRPWRARMHVSDFVATGQLEPLPPSVLDHAVFRSGAGGYHTYRIPAAVVAADGSILAFCEGRKGGRGDSGDIDLLLRRSTDGGATWSEPQVVWDDGPNTCGNPAPVVDRATGRVVLLATWNRGDDHEREIIAEESEDTRRVFVLTSDDHGVTWSEVREITADVKADDWTWYATGPCNGIQLERGDFAGRLVVPCDHIEAGSRRYYSHAIYSDDGGASWQRGASTPKDQVNECAVVELSDGRLLLNMRNYDRTQRQRQIALSDDGGANWYEQRFAPELVEPICQASMVRWTGPTADAPGVLLFSNPASQEGRVRMTVHASVDDGATWDPLHVLHPGPSAYSQLVVLPNGEAACLFEAGDGSPYEAIVWVPIPGGPPGD